MAIFRKKEKDVLGLLGVDIGAGGMKVVELVPDEKRLRLSTYGYSEFKDPTKYAGLLVDNPKVAAEVLRKIISESGMKSTRANASLPSHSVFHTIITIPQPRDEKEDIKLLIENQVRKLLPRPLEEMILDSTVIDKHLLPKKEAAQKEGVKKKEESSKTNANVDADSDQVSKVPVVERKHVRVLVSGAPKDLVEKYVNVFRAAKIDLVSLETEAFALIRSLVGNDKARIMIVDIGYERTNITIVSEGFPFLHRSIKSGGAAVTNAISETMGISHQEAEQTKLDMAVTPPSGGLPDSLKIAMQPILHEVKYSLELYSQQEPNRNQVVEKIVITGGSAHLPHIGPFLTEALNISVYLGNPWARIASPEGIKPVLEEIGPRFSVAVGLAMKGIKA